nr:MAG TPA: hypothetical protein [Myoviridae sp. ctNPX13]
MTVWGLFFFVKKEIQSIWNYPYTLYRHVFFVL